MKKKHFFLPRICVPVFLETKASFTQAKFLWQSGFSTDNYTCVNENACHSFFSQRVCVCMNRKFVIEFLTKETNYEDRKLPQNQNSLILKM